MIIKFILNEKLASLDCDPLRPLSEILREEFDLLGVKSGCKNGACGSCSVLIEGKMMLSCLIPVYKVLGKDVVTIEGYAETKGFAEIEQAFQETGVIPCGLCAPSRVLQIHTILEGGGELDDEEIWDIFKNYSCSCLSRTMMLKTFRLIEEKRRKKKRGRS